MKIATVSLALFVLFCVVIDSAYGQCQCKFHGRRNNGQVVQTGCRIITPARPNHACKCILQGTRCSAQMIKCPYNLQSRVCLRPDTSKDACHLGSEGGSNGGNCGGYY